MLKGFTNAVGLSYIDIAIAMAMFLEPVRRILDNTGFARKNILRTNNNSIRKIITLMAKFEPSAILPVEVQSRRWFLIAE